jgi:uncharacterized protein (TIGR02996 family)
MFRIHPRLWLPALVLVSCLPACSGAESRKASFVSQAEKHLAAHDWRKARLDLANALQIDPKDAKLQFLQAQVAEKVGEFNEAASRYRALLEQDKENLGARASLARLYAGGGLADEAVKLAEEGLATHADDPGLLTARGIARAMRGDNSGALKDAESASALAPNDPDTAALLAGLYQRQGRGTDALQVLQRAAAASPDNVNLRLIFVQALAGAGRTAEAEQQLLAVIKLEPRQFQHRYRLAQFHVLQKNPDAAEKALRDAIAVSPDEVEPKLALANLIAAQRSFETGEKSLKSLVASAPGNLELQLGLGRFYEAHQRPVLAEDVYRSVVRKAEDKPQGLTARNRMAALELAANRSSEAGTLIAEVLKNSPRDNEALTMRANIAMARGDTTSAIADLRSVLRDQPDAPVLMRALAAAYLANRDVGLAEETLRTAIRANPTDVQTRLALADLLMKSGRGDEAQPVASQLVTDQPGDAQALEAAFKIQLARRDFDAARSTAGTIHALRPDLPAGDFLAGLVDEAEGKLDSARVAFERAIRQAPGFVEPLAAAVRIDLAQHQEGRALARVDEALAERPQSSGLLALKAEVLSRLKRYDDSVAASNQAIAHSPAWWVGYEDLARAELARQRPEAAIAAYERGIQATQSAPPLVVNLGAVYERLGRVDQAMALYDEWLKREPGSEVASNNLAMLLVTYKSKESGGLDRALQLSKRLEKSTQAEFVDTLGWVQYLRGEYVPAIEVLQRAVTAAPSAAVFRAHLGLAQFKAGQRDAARENLQRALAGQAGFPEADEARAALRQLR